MGKCSSNSNHSLKTKMSGVRKSGKATNEKKWRKKNEKIKKLFRDLRDASSSSTIVINDDTPPPSVTPRKKISMHSSTPVPGRTANAVVNLDVSSIANAGNFNDEVMELTKEIKSRCFQTVDLTGEVDGTVIDLNSVSDTQDCILVSDNTSMSGDSEVTVLRKPSTSRNSTINRVAKGLNGMIANLGPSSQTKLLELITNNIFKGCQVPSNIKENLIQDRTLHIGETPEDLYLKDMFTGKRQSNCSVGSNIYNPPNPVTKKTGPRTIVIDGSNVAMEHGKGRVFSVRGLKICIDYFVNRGHEVRAFVPRFRCKFGKSTDPKLLDALERRGLVVYTPSREIRGKRITSYDDRYIVQYAAAVDGVIVSGDNFRDLLSENPRWQRTICGGVLPFTWVQDMIMFPRDPLGRNGPTLEHFLHHHDV